MEVPAWRHFISHVRDTDLLLFLSFICVCYNFWSRRMVGLNPMGAGARHGEGGRDGVWAHWKNRCESMNVGLHMQTGTVPSCLSFISDAGWWGFTMLMVYRLCIHITRFFFVKGLGSNAHICWVRSRHSARQKSHYSAHPSLFSFFFSLPGCLRFYFSTTSCSMCADRWCWSAQRQKMLTIDCCADRCAWEEPQL